MERRAFRRDELRRLRKEKIELRTDTEIQRGGISPAGR
jgi:hypothetical protein